MKKLYFLATLLMMSLASQAQKTYQYEFDEAGNRKARYEVTLSSGDGESLISDGAFNPNNLKIETLEDYIAGKNLKIYPNPTRGELVLEFTEFPEDSPITMKLFDSNGRLLKSELVNGQYHLLDINNEPNGNYLLVLTLKKFKKTYQIIKQ